MLLVCKPGFIILNLKISGPLHCTGSFWNFNMKSHFLKILLNFKRAFVERSGAANSYCFFVVRSLISITHTQIIAKKFLVNFCEDSCRGAVDLKFNRKSINLKFFILKFLQICQVFYYQDFVPQ